MQGNESSSTYATTEINTPKGEVAEVFSFSGLLPEVLLILFPLAIKHTVGLTQHCCLQIINGRAAMVGMLAAFGAELATHQPVFVQVRLAQTCCPPTETFAILPVMSLHLCHTMMQIQKTPVLILGAFVTVILASVAPVLRNADLNRQGAGPFTQEAEVNNFCCYL